MTLTNLLSEALAELAKVQPKPGSTTALANGKQKVREARTLAEAPPSIEQGARLYGTATGTTGDAPWSTETWDRWEADAGKKTSILAYGQPFGAVGLTPLQLCAARSAVPLVTVMTENTTIAQIAEGGADAKIDAMAGVLASFGKRVLLRFAHEFNGNWYAYGYTKVSPALYASAFRRVASRIRAKAPLVEMVWCPNIIGGSSVADPGPWYPGSEAVQILGVDGYNFNATSPVAPTAVFAPTIKRLEEIEPNRPIYICETGCVECPGKPASAYKAGLASSYYRTP